MAIDDEHSDRPAVGEPLNNLGGIPPGFGVRLETGARWLGGRAGDPVLLGGSPLRLLRLRPVAKRLIETLTSGSTVADAAAATGVSVDAAGRLARRLIERGLAQPIPPQPTEPPTTSAFGEPSVGPSSSDSAPNVTIVIPAYNRAAGVERLLNALREAGNPSPVIVVDDGSTDGTSAVAERFGAQVVRHDRPRGPAAARNAGIFLAATPYVACIDSDCVPSSPWIKQLLPHFADDSVFFVAPRIVGIEHTKTAVLSRYEHIRSPLDLGPTPSQIVPRTRVAYVPAAAFVARTDVMRELGGFDERLHVGEDVDLLWRAHQHGHRARYEPASSVAHDHRTEWASFSRRRFDYGTSAAVLEARHPGQVPPLAVSGWSVLVWAGLVQASPAGISASAATLAGTTALLARKLDLVEEPARLAVDLAGRGHLGAGRQLGSALWRTYLPLTLALAPFLRTARRALVASAIVPNLLEWRERRPQLDPVRYVAVRLLDDASYCAGTWAGALRQRSVRSLLPDLSSWPGRGRPSDS